MKDHISSVLKLSNEEQENGLKALIKRIFDDLEWINSDRYCKTIKHIFLELQLDNMFFRETS
jgi:hypothetical protein